jgi:hypothetical protein
MLDIYLVGPPPIRCKNPQYILAGLGAEHATSIVRKIDILQTLDEVVAYMTFLPVKQIVKQGLPAKGTMISSLSHHQALATCDQAFPWLNPAVRQ